MKIGTTTITTTTTTFVTTSAWWWLLLLLLGPLGGGNNSNHRSKGHSFAIATYTASECEMNGVPHNDEVSCKEGICNGETITNCKSVHCDGYDYYTNCQSAEIENVDLVLCEGFQACYGARIKNAAVVECHGGESCAGAVIENVDSVFCDGGNFGACYRSRITNAELVECHGSGSCGAASISKTGLIVCNGGEGKHGAACEEKFKTKFRISGDTSTTCLRCEGAKGCGKNCYFGRGNCNSAEDAEFGTCDTPSDPTPSDLTPSDGKTLGVPPAP